MNIQGKPNKKILLLLIVLVISAAIFIWLKVSSVELDNPESIAYDKTGDRFLISNTGGRSIVSMDSTGALSTFLKGGMQAPRGIMIVSPFLYVADNKQVHVIDIPTQKISQSIPIEGAAMLNDIEIDKNGLLYLTDTKAHYLFILDPATKKVEKFTAPQLNSPNGIVYDRPRNQMFIVCNSMHSSILSFDTINRTFSIFKDTIYSNLDGIAIDDLGRIYFSSWQENAIYMIPQEQNRFILFKRDMPAAADMIYHLPTNELIVPLFNKNRIVRIPLD
ncbi:MAG: SMP-30/gluconolactonase/LRE family protein [Candidatus Cloacimonadaceae bacterium]|nr:SMP-30/gluconolactonase/LRE family protein [Candidatus Cloacimonadaceae bacterium]MDP3114618.1 SMP-30/gluconolactonase/LRE family protein [Candidatus Cloacimonadaceae bacterium]